MAEIIKNIPLTFIPLFVAIDIFAVLPIFLAMTHGLSASKHKKAINESIVTALFVSVVFIAVGEVIFKILGITNDDFKIAGGLVLLVFAILDLLRRNAVPQKADSRFGIVPIGVPLIVGPAVLTTLLVLVDHYGAAPAIISLLLNLLIVWLCFIKGQTILKLFGEGGIIAVSKVMALLLASIAVMMIRIGIVNIITKNAG